MIISTERWRALVVWCGLLGMALAKDFRDGGDESSSPSGRHMSTMSRDDRQAGYFRTTWNSFPPIVTLGQNYILNYKVIDDASKDDISRLLILCYTNKPEVNLDATNTWTVLFNVSYGCSLSDSHGGFCHFSKDLESTVDITLDLRDNTTALEPYENATTNAFFFCFTDEFDETTGSVVCGSYSPFFRIAPAALAPSSAGLKRQAAIPTLASAIDSEASSITSAVAATATAAATSLFTILSSTGLLSQIGANTNIVSQTSASDAPTTAYSWIATVTTSPTSPPTGTGADSADATGTSSSPTSKSSGLSLGAKIGIALGLIIFAFFILLAILLFLRRRRKNPPPNSSRTPENPLLSSSLKNNESRDLFVAEKLGLTDRSDTNTPLTSRGAGIGMGMGVGMGMNMSTGGPYDHEEVDDLSTDLPAPGSAFTANTPVPISPRRSQAAHTLRSEGLGSQPISIASGISRPVSPVNSGAAGSNSSDSGDLSRETSRERIGERSLFDQEPYTDNVGANGTGTGTGVGAGAIERARNEGRSILDIPKVYQGTLQAPFLSEPGMSPEEVATLEEEERRIDEAIAEAEEERRRAREVRGR
ncbi:hypothetical protein SBOR_0768 [Sclerotinia borealis F-4128]|uniref:Uncharacterized protein n=1 Tax=Sclerotinia borealis (strain F-4128) TaxID=1432307 RepID=W9CWI3_SCLBF|nr:hypothetical protein SBOR_0768 [Sclerotinia borealis F-4128]